MPGINAAQLFIAAIGGVLTLVLVFVDADAARLVGGLALLVLGADWLVDASAALAKRLGVSSFVVGLSVVAFGTSAPELGVGIKAALEGEGELAVGNVVGSNIANICLILGLTALLRPVRCHSRLIREDVPVMIGVTALAMIFMASSASIGRIEGAVLVLGILGYLAWLIQRGRSEPSEVADPIASQLAEMLHTGADDKHGPAWIQALLAIIGATMLWQGSELLVTGASSIATAMGVSPAIIGITIVAFGTSVPELVTSVNATIKRESDIAVGNILGSNIFNLLSVLGISAIFAPLAVDAGTIMRDMWIMLAVAMVCLPIMSQGRIVRWVGTILVLAYAAYIALSYISPA